MELKNNDKTIALLRKLKLMGKQVDDNVFTITNPSIKITSLKTADEITGFEVEADKKGLALIKKMEDSIELIKESDLTGTGLTIDDMKTKECGKLFYERERFLYIIKDLKNSFNKVAFNQKIDKAFVNDKLTLYINPVLNNTDDTTKTLKIDNDFGIKNDIYAQDFDDKKDVDLKYKEKLFGRYYRNRNTLVLWANIFQNYDLFGVVLGAKLKEMKMTEIDVSKFKLMAITKVFTKDISARVKDKEQKIDDNRRRITEYQNGLQTYYNQLVLFDEEIHALKTMKENFNGKFYDEIEKTKKLPIVKDVSFTATEVIITYHPTCITVTDFSRGYKKSGKRSMYVGSVQLKLGADDIRVDNDETMKTYKTSGDPESGIHGEYPHPHAMLSGECCLGLQSTKDTLYLLRSSLKLSDIALYFWMFVKNYGTDGGYMKPYLCYDYCLMHGLPIFDEKGKHIYINDVDRIKSEEQIKLKKAKDYDDNVAKFKDFKPM